MRASLRWKMPLGEAWLNADDRHPLQALWHRKDALAVNQLFLLGDSIVGLSQIDARWVGNHVGKIKSKNRNERQGSMFELLAVNLFRRPPQTIRPTQRNAAGFDAVLSLPDGAEADISLKSYGTSTHEETFEKQAAATEQVFIQAMKAVNRSGSYFGAIALSYPSTSDWDALRATVPNLIANPPALGQMAQIGKVWRARVNNLPQNFGPYSDRYFSYQVFMLAPFHANESKNLFDKFEDACANAIKHAKSKNDLVRIVLVRVPETISLVACDQWTKQYVRDNPAGPIDAIFLYQPTVADQPDGGSVMSHPLVATETANFAAWRAPPSMAPRRFSIDFAVGVSALQPTRRQIVGGPMPIQLDDGYVYQKGDFFKLYKFDPRGVTNMNITNLASGIMQHAILELPGGPQELLTGYLPPLKEITLFD